MDVLIYGCHNPTIEFSDGDSLEICHMQSLIHQDLSTWCLAQVIVLHFLIFLVCLNNYLNCLPLTFCRPVKVAPPSTTNMLVDYDSYTSFLFPLLAGKEGKLLQVDLVQGPRFEAWQAQCGGFNPYNVGGWPLVATRCVLLPVEP